MSSLLLAQSFTPSTTAVAGNVFLTAIVGLLPLVVFFVLMGVFKVATHWCSIISLVLSLLIAVFAFQMPAGMALLAGTQGAAMGFMPIIYIIIAAVWLYNLTEKSGRSADLKAVFNTIGRGDQRAQALIVAWCFCGLLEGLAGFGAPVAITCAMLVTLGVPKIKAAVVTVVGNAINVGFGAMAIPTTTAGKLGGADPVVVAGDMGHLTWIFCLFIPLLMLFILDGGARRTSAVAPRPRHGCRGRRGSLLHPLGLLRADRGRRFPARLRRLLRLPAAVGPQDPRGVRDHDQRGRQAHRLAGARVSIR
ncbi:Glycolate permease glcA [Schaalia odontolytica]|uniref:L-lactate permease n=1 Tax=Schaalia odontolytica TaxID=1660 RepID=A0A2X0VRM9_9ACTO|nr:Glycolate permease glcA [Schaalia odontolytica]